MPGIALWGSFGNEAEMPPITDVQREELERRRLDSIARPDAVNPWEEIKARAMARARQ